MKIDLEQLKTTNSNPALSAASLELVDILDVPALKSLMNDLSQLTYITISIIDLKGNVLMSIGWPDICTRFHRVHPETCRHCIESDTQLSLGVAPGEFKLYKCKNNMWNFVTGLIVEGQHIANIFSGHFFFEDETLDYELFRSQARKYGFNEEEYIKALEKVPRLSRETVNKNMSFLMKLANMISQLSHSNFKLSQALEECDILVDELKKNKGDLDRAQEVGNLGSWRMDARKKELTWSDENYRIFGIPKGTHLTYETFLSKVHPDDRKYVQKEWIAKLKGEPYSIEHRIIVDGNVKWVRKKAYFEFDTNGEIVGGFGITQDITERKKAEEALKRAHDGLEAKVKERTDELEKAYESLMEEKRRLSEAQKIAHIGNWDWNLATNEMYWSDEMCRIFGCVPQKVFHKYSELFNFIHPEDRSYVYNTVNSALHGKFFSIDHRIISSDESDRVVHSHGEVVFDEKKRPILLRGTIQDITDIMKTEEKIRTLADVVESSNDAIITETLDGIIASWNKAAEQIYGYSAEEILGKNVSIFEPDNLKGEIRKFVEMVKRGEIVQHHKTLRLKKDGRLINVSITYSPVFDASGKLKAVSAISRDITEQVNAERLLAKAEDARKKEIHHRIKNNLQVISSLLDLQAEKFRNRKHAENEEVLNAFIESQDRVMSIALIHEELHEGRGNDTINFSSYIKRLVENLFQTYKLGNVNTILNIELEENIFFDMDIAVPLGIIINELVSNSLKYAFLGRDNGKIQIKLYKEDSAEYANKEQENTKESFNVTDFVLIVSDNGIGIPDEFYLEDSNSLGLQLVETLVDQLGGKIELKRSFGTEFCIRFTVPVQN
ncbi:sensory transduction histidine kinase [Methanosarcina sp. Kolksee]|uniref:PocR ligand-binding domain-containing protein n=1 Tax=Methanosarcina sp. Kolksee TaxID=1434099 RepID=UPI000615BB65|nr:PocR ligand-binding domain-containing protein [Methanosarcina sp. Kolksee]AKB47919.1 sensory transduction histidine kinase [Methanosarcina sp. Kolksee]